MWGSPVDRNETPLGISHLTTRLEAAEGQELDLEALAREVERVDWPPQEADGNVYVVEELPLDAVVPVMDFDVAKGVFVDLLVADAVGVAHDDIDQDTVPHDQCVLVGRVIPALSHTAPAPS